MPTVHSAAPQVGVDQKQYRVVLEDEFSAKALLHLAPDCFRFAKAGRSAEPWFEAAYTSIENVSLTKPHITLRAPNGKKLTVAFSSESDVDEALLRLQRINHGLHGAQDSTTSPAQQALASIAGSPEALSAAKKRLHTGQMIAGAIAFAIGFVVTTTTYERVAEKGGLYIVTWGALLFGPLLFLRGLVGWVSQTSADAAEKAGRERAVSAVAARPSPIDPEIVEVDDGQLGECPNCARSIPLQSKECKYCHAAFGPGSAWRINPASLPRDA